MIVNFEDSAERAKYISRDTYRKVPIYRKVPAGCGQQGRDEEREAHGVWADTEPAAPMPSEACTELGIEDYASPQASAVFWSLYLAITLVGIVAAVAAVA